MPLTERKDVFVISTPGHTIGHQSVVIIWGNGKL
jgi:glyoxylase-like metal-dependent hydrolase (beta-lactamase superfamily II)